MVLVDFEYTFDLRGVWNKHYSYYRFIKFSHMDGFIQSWILKC